MASPRVINHCDNAALARRVTARKSVISKLMEQGDSGISTWY